MRKKNPIEEFMADSGKVGKEEIARVTTEEELARAATGNAERLRKAFYELDSMHVFYTDWLESEKAEVAKKIELLKRQFKTSTKGRKTLESVIKDYEQQLEYLNRKKQSAIETTRVISGILNSKLQENFELKSLAEIEIISKTEKQNLSYIG